jgi:uncharacterized membrane protein YsdA (DUF1294 family)
MTLHVPLIVCAYVLASVVTFLAYGWDKRRATGGRNRISERTLHLLELLGGWPGAWLGQRYFHHKWRKASYMLAFWLIVALHAAAWVLYVWR